MNARALVLIVGAGLLIAGIIGLLWPISATSGNDAKSVGCGRALVSNYDDAKAADQNLSNTGADVLNQVGAGSLSPAVPGQTDYVGACKSELGTQRAWTIPVAVIGVLVLAGSFLVRGGRRAAP